MFTSSRGAVDRPWRRLGHADVIAPVGEDQVAADFQVPERFGPNRPVIALLRRVAWLGVALRRIAGLARPRIDRSAGGHRRPALRIALGRVALRRITLRVALWRISLRVALWRVSLVGVGRIALLSLRPLRIGLRIARAVIRIACRQGEREKRYSGDCFHGGTNLPRHYPFRQLALT